MSEVSVKPSSEGGSRSKLPGIGEGDGGSALENSQLFVPVKCTRFL